MRHPIDPKIDCVFKALLGAEENRNLLIHFLNAILGPDLPDPITQVEILNPYNEREFLGDKLSVVDVKARDGQGRLYQVEIQLLTHRDLPARILYTWADLYKQQLQSGQDYALLRPTYAIWLLGEDLLTGDPKYAHRYRLRDDEGRCLLDHGGINLLELNKFAAEPVETEAERWLRFFKDGELLDADEPPAWMQTAEMRQAMTTLRAFSEKERAYDAYQARQDFIREQNSIQRHRRELEQRQRELEQHQLELDQHQRELEQQQHELERVIEEQRAALDAALLATANERQAAEAQRQETEAQRHEAEAAREAKEAALAEVERLKALLKEKTPPTAS